MDMVQPMPYTAVQQLIDAGNQPGFNHYWKAEFIDELTDEAIDTFVPLVLEPSSPLTATILQPLGGVPSRVPEDSTALGRRDAAFAFHALTQWEGDDHERHIEWARNVQRAMAPYTAPGVYLTYSSDEGEERSRAAFGEAKFTRLRAIKDLYDPIDMFKTGAAIRPTASG
jgi:hypothetical protein